MRYRGRLLLLAVASAVTAAVLGLLLAPVFINLATRLHLGCTEVDTGGVAEWVCPDGVAYLIPGLMLVAAIAVSLFTAGVLIMLRRLPPTTPRAEVTRAVARDLGWCGATPLVAQAPVSVFAAMSSTYSPRALQLGLLVGVAALAPLLASRTRGWLYPVACVLAAACAGSVIRSAVLLAPAIVGCAGLLIAAAVVSVGGAHGTGRKAAAPVSG